MAYRSFEEAPKTLVITSRIPIVYQWKEAFEGVSNIDYLCIQSAYKYIGDYDLVIIDEVHRALSPEYRKVFESITTKALICLTATLPQDEEYVEFLEKVSPVVYSKHLSEVVEYGVIPKFAIYNLEVPLDRSLRGKYARFDSNFASAVITLTKMRRDSATLTYKYASIFDLAREVSKDTEDSPLRRAAKQYWGGMQMRKLVVYNNSEKIKTTKYILENIGPNRK